MATNPLGEGTKNLSVNMPEKMKSDLETLASKSGLTLGAYVRAILQEAVKDGDIVEYQIARISTKKQTEP
jgi:predicted DNA-binding protein